MLCADKERHGTRTTPLQISPKSKRSGLSTVSLVLAIASLPLTILYLTGVLTAILAIPLGHVALRQARHSASSTHTNNKAIVGLVISYLYLGFAVAEVGCDESHQ